MRTSRLRYEHRAMRRAERSSRIRRNDERSVTSPLAPTSYPSPDAARSDSAESCVQSSRRTGRSTRKRRLKRNLGQEELQRKASVEMAHEFEITARSKLGAFFNQSALEVRSVTTLDTSGLLLVRRSLRDLPSGFGKPAAPEPDSFARMLAICPIRYVSKTCPSPA